MANHYKTLRNRYLPSKIKTIFVLESPPAGGKYFYNPEGKVTEPLFSAMMTALGIKVSTKESGLKQFQQKGYVLVNAIYTPVNRLPDKIADKKILKNYPALVADLKKHSTKPGIRLILAKANICRLLEPRLANDGFLTLNRGLVIPFPIRYHRRVFIQTIKRLLKNRHALFSPL